MNGSAARMWAEYAAAAGINLATPWQDLCFGYSPEVQDELAALVVSGVKRATTSLRRDYHDTRPRRGDHYVVVDGPGDARCVIRTTQVDEAALSAVTEAHAYLEGEGDRSLDYWLASHRQYFTQQAEIEGFAMQDDLETVFERFEVVWPQDIADTSYVQLPGQRRTARLILLDPDNRLLMMKIKGEWGDEAGRPIWITLGGGLEKGESVMDAALREAWEESGIQDIEIGPAIAYIESMGFLNKQPCLFRETFVAAHAPSSETRHDNWTELERQVVAELRWWTLEELRTTDEIILPPMLVELLPDVIAGRYPEEMPRLTVQSMSS